jgi:protein-tyrosine kinase
MTPSIESARIIPGPGSYHGAPDRSIGAMLMDAGKLTPEDGERILRYAKEKRLRFGDAAVALKLVSQDDIAQILARQFDYPYLVPGQSNVSPEVVAAWAPFSPQMEALRALRSQLMLRWFSAEEDHKSLAVVSPGKSEGRSHLAANLAVVFSQMGEKTLLIDADLRSPRQHELFGLENTSGLSAVLAERSDLNVIARIPAFVDLSVLTAGAVPPNPLELLGRDGFEEVMQACSETFDDIVVDTPAAELGADGQIVSSRCHGALMVARRNHTSLEDCRDLSEAIKASGVALVGGVLNDG